MNILESNEWNELSLDDKVDTVISMLNTPIFRRKLGDPGLSKAILGIYTELHNE